MQTFFAICTLLSPIVWYYLGHYNGYKWARKNPDKLHIEKFFEVEKQEPAK